MALSSVGPYRILERLGAGANGEVWLAEDTRLHRRVALKTLSGTAGSDASELRRKMLREARAAARLNHPHIAAVYDVLESDEGVHIVMEYVRGATLATRIRQGPPTPMQVVDIALQLSSAMAHAHSLGVIHRDLKPANVIESPDGGAKILDFGLARLHEVDAGSVPLSASEASVDVRHTVGTPPYIPPEHLHGAPVDARGDIYSLGVTLFELLTGRRPFEAGNGMGLTEAILSAPTPRPRTFCAEVPDGLDAIVYRAMARNPDDRYPAAAELESDLKRLSAGITDVPTQSRAWPLAGGRATRRLGWIAAALVAGALGVYGVVGPLGGGTATAPPVPPGPKVVAVLPLAGASDPETQSLAAGVADSLITTLSKVAGLTVVSRAATLKYQDSKREPDDIAAELGATMLVHGRLQRSGDKLRITLSLLEPGAKFVRWQNEYDGTFAEVFSLQREVADAVARALSLESDPIAVVHDQPSRNIEAFAESAQARAFLERPDVHDNLDRSIGLFQSAIQKDPRYARAHAGLGEAYWRKYQVTHDEKWSVRARDAINEALRLDPTDASVRLSLAAIYRGMGRVKEATEELEKVVASSPQSDEAHRQLGLLLMSKGEHERGIAEMQEAIRLRPTYWAHYHTLGSAYYNLGRYPEAVKAFQRIIDLQPDSAWGYSALGTAYHAMDDTAAAEPLYEKAIALGSATAHANLGVIYSGQGRYEDAARSYQEAIKREPESSLQHYNLGTAYSHLGREKDAAVAYRRALDLCQAQLRVNPRDSKVLARLAVVETKLGRKQDAARDIEKAVALDPANADVRYAQAIVHARSGRLDDAIAALREAFRNGYSRFRADRDPDLLPLKQHAEYEGLIRITPTGGAR